MNQIFLGQAMVCFENFKYENNPELKIYLESQVFQDFAMSFDSKIIIVLGGDGGMLRAIAEYHDLGLPFLGINFGNKGFLLHPKEAIGTYAFERVDYPLLHARGTFGESVCDMVAFNEIDIRARDGRILSLRVEGISPGGMLEFSGDGLIISTPVGSSGYNLSLGGPLLRHCLDTLVITPKAVIQPRGLPSYVFPLDTALKIQNAGRKTGVLVYADSREVYDGDAGDFLIQLLKSSRISILIPSGGIGEWQKKFFSIHNC